MWNTNNPFEANIFYGISFHSIFLDAFFSSLFLLSLRFTTETQIMAYFIFTVCRLHSFHSTFARKMKIKSKNTIEFCIIYRFWWVKTLFVPLTARQSIYALDWWLSVIVVYSVAGCLKRSKSKMLNLKLDQYSAIFKSNENEWFDLC